MSDAAECLKLLEDQKNLLKEVLTQTEVKMDKVGEKSELALFFFLHGWNVYEMAKASIVLMKAEEPFGTVVLARSALESTFNVAAASKDKSFGGEKLAHELDDLARKLEMFIKAEYWHSGRKPSPEDCRKGAQQIRTKYKVGEKKWDKIEQIARLGELTPYYEDDYRFLSLQVHANQAGVFNTITGFLARKGLIALANAMYFTAISLADVFHLRESFDGNLSEIRSRMEAMMRRPDFLPASDHFSV